MSYARPFTYPVPDVAAFQRGPAGQLPYTQRAYLWATSHLKPVRRNRIRQLELTPIQTVRHRSLQADDLPLIFLAHNCRRYLPSFFAHYRRLGVTRFLCVDDQSDDGTREFLTAQPDTDVYASNLRYGAALRGRGWREAIVDMYGKNRWYLNLDSDEYLFYERSDTQTLREFIQHLEAHNLRRLPAIMLDLYPTTPLEQAVFTGDDDTPPWQIATHFDGDGYEAAVARKGFEVCGGIRRRLLGAYPQLIKYPLLYWDQSTSMGNSIHWPAPPHHNFAPALGVLLHPKIFAGFVNDIHAIIRNGQHVQNAGHYKKLLQGFEQLATPQLGYAGSVPFTDVADLQARGFLLPLP